MLIWEQLVKVAADVGVVGKDAQNRDQGYSFRSIDDVIAAVHPALVKHGVSFLPVTIKDREVWERATRSGGSMRGVGLTVVFRFAALDGSFVDVESRGEGMDTSDKATNKAVSAAAKYALTLALTIPVKGDDADYESPQVPEPEPLPAVVVKQAVAKALRGTDWGESVAKGEVKAVWDRLLASQGISEGDVTLEMSEQIVAAVLAELEPFDAAT